MDGPRRRSDSRNVPAFFCSVDHWPGDCGDILIRHNHDLGRNVRQLQNMPGVQSRMPPGAFEAGRDLPEALQPKKVTSIGGIHAGRRS
jgi:hypothetical protein